MYKIIFLVPLLYLNPLLARASTSNQITCPSGTQMVLIGDAKNQADEYQHGSCEDSFSIGAYEWTVADWKGMLDNIASKVDPLYCIADPHGLWNNKMEHWIHRDGSAITGYHYNIISGAEYLPITNVNFFDICRACNYTQNKGMLPLAPNISFDTITENGAYTIKKYFDFHEEALLTSDACYFIPTQDQWVKAAYYKGGNLDAGYWNYPTQHDNNPGDREGPVKENRANYNLYLWDYWAPALQLSPVNYCGGFNDQGQVVGSCSAYGCFDMAGNVNEWTITKYESTEEMIVLGGDYTSEYYMEPGVNNYLMRTCQPKHVDPNTRSDVIGFRMAAIANNGHIISDKNKFNTGGFFYNFTTGEQVTSITLTVGVAILTIKAGANAITDLMKGAKEANQALKTEREVQKLLAQEANLLGPVNDHISLSSTLRQDTIDKFYEFVNGARGIEYNGKTYRLNYGRGDDCPLFSKKANKLAKDLNEFYDCDDGQREFRPPSFSKEKAARALYNLIEDGESILNTLQ